MIHRPIQNLKPIFNSTMVQQMVPATSLPMPPQIPVPSSEGLSQKSNSRLDLNPSRTFQKLWQPGRLISHSNSTVIGWNWIAFPQGEFISFCTEKADTVLLKWKFSCLWKKEENFLIHIGKCYFEHMSILLYPKVIPSSSI